MKKKHFIFSVLVLGALCFVSLFVQADSKKKPNVILIQASDLGRGLLSAYGQKHFTTPNIDVLINNGVSFANAYGGSLSAYSRAALFTGHHDCNKGYWRIPNGGVYAFQDTVNIRERENIVDESSIFLSENELYLPQVFRKAGYVTGQIGKLGIGNVSTRQQMIRYGWDYCYGFLDFNSSQGYYPPFLFENEQISIIEGNTRIDGGRSVSPETELTYQDRWKMDGKKQYAPALFLRKIIDFLHECKDFPFFLIYSTPLPHGPVSVPAVHPEVVNNDALTQVEKEYASMVKLLDEHIGIIMKELQALNLDENTMIVFTSDNGHNIHYLQYGRIDRPFVNYSIKELFDNLHNKYYSSVAGDVFNGNAGLAGLKYSNLEGGIRIPLTFYWKGKLHKGLREDIVSGYDFLPTMADLLGIKLQSEKDGVSILSLLTKGKKLLKNRYVIIGSEEGPVIITNEGWKLRFYNQKKIYELYNLKKDPEEKYNVILRFPEIAEKLKKTLLDECEGKIENGIFYN